MTGDLAVRHKQQRIINVTGCGELEGRVLYIHLKSSTLMAKDFKDMRKDMTKKPLDTIPRGSQCY